MPRSLVTRLARAKAEDARDQIANDKDIADAYVLAADTVVAVGRRILVKPRFVEEALATLQLLSGRNHRVLTALCLITPDDRVRLKIVDTRVRFKRLSKEEIEAYIASREWRGKAGGYAIQGLAGCFVQKMVGSYTNVVGLPLTEVVNMLLGEGFPIHFNWLKAGRGRPGVMRVDAMAHVQAWRVQTRRRPRQVPDLRPADREHYRPFCSRRCADVDLSRWLRGAYAIPDPADDDEDGESAEPPESSKKDDPGTPPTDSGPAAPARAGIAKRNIQPVRYPQAQPWASQALRPTRRHLLAASVSYKEREQGADAWLGI